MITVLDILQEHFQSIRPGLGPQWPEFSRRVGKLAGRFQAIAAEEQPAPGAVQTAVNDLLEICRDYPYLAGLLGLGSKRPPAPAQELQFNPKEIANRYYSLLTRLKTATPVKEDTDDRRSNA